MDYPRLVDECAAQDIGVIAIRVFAGGALSHQPPSAHTKTTKFFPLDLYERDRQRAARLESVLGGISLPEASLRFVLGTAGSEPLRYWALPVPSRCHWRTAFAERGPLPPSQLQAIRAAATEQ